MIEVFVDSKDEEKKFYEVFAESKYKYENKKSMKTGGC